ncbi:uncharacterized protein M421DRAFT_857 [Didymella exigua CBS 183.55]|uniref:Uncharacterized protein n=1 Tax=Didymella exigua CBS 183.55 TaxID=1150837 RepID=A0A6A5S0Y7_9PLEO|nr:uncharacterized protein M421DRAFT_857 [Didymella exigua CBS 183.55]KAF1933449.1 hypothetical protein M421DRAFT_857 [Didymella exigua CBS 183.55]
MGSIPSSSGGGNPGDEYDKDKKSGKGKGDERGQKLDKKALMEKKNAVQEKARQADFAEKVKDKNRRMEENDKNVRTKLKEIRQQQRSANGAGAAPLEMTEEDKEIPTTETEDTTPKKPARPEMTEEEEERLKNIRAAARKERERKEQEEREEDEPKKLQATVQGSNSTVDSLANDAESKERKRRLKPRASAPSVAQDPSDSDSIKPPQPSTPVKPKPKAIPEAKPVIRKPPVPFAEHLAAEQTAQGGEPKPKTPKKTSEPKRKAKTSGKSGNKETKAVKTNGNKEHKSAGFVADSDLENDSTEDIELRSDKLQSDKLGVEITSITTMTTVAVEVQQRDGSAERTQVTDTTTARRDSSEYGETTIGHTSHVQTVTELDVLHQELPHDSPSSSPEQDLQDGFNTSTNAMGIKLSVSHPPASTPLTSPSSHRKHKSSSDSEEAQSEPKAEQQDLPSSPSSPKKRKITPPASPSTDDGTASYSPSTAPAENAVSSEDVTTTPKPTSSSPPISPGAASVASSISSSSSQKRKAIWSEDDGQITISPGGTKRAKGVQSSGAKVIVELEDVVKVEAEDDQESFDSLFDE